MNDMDRFEERLKRQPFRAAPNEWREEILASARDHLPSVTPKQSWLSTLHRQLSTLFWPSPKAWLGLAGAWVLIVAVQISVHNEPIRLASRTRTEPAAVKMALQQQQQLMAELLGPRDRLQADRPKTAPPRPRSEVSPRWSLA